VNAFIISAIFATSLAHLVLLGFIAVIIFGGGVRTGSGSHPAYYPIGTRGSFPGGESAGA
jgi:hypothetical protein